MGFFRDLFGGIPRVVLFRSAERVMPAAARRSPTSRGRGAARYRAKASPPPPRAKPVKVRPRAARDRHNWLRE